MSEIDKRVVPSLVEGVNLTFVTVQDGLSKHSFVTANQGEMAEDVIAQLGRFPCTRFWETCQETDQDHGWAVCFGILQEEVWHGPCKLSKRQIDEIYEELGEGNGILLRLELEEFEERGAEPTVLDYFLTALWADLFLERFSLSWYAAQAMHAHIVAQNDFAFGYLVRELEAKIEHEADAMRGKRTLSAASLGGKNKGLAFAGSKSEMLKTMERLIQERRLSISRAAELTFQQGLGTSKTANRAAWYRSKKS